MKITPLPQAQPRPGRKVAIGTFDGVHLGHREVIGDSDTVLTFDPHPLAVIRPDALPKLLNSHRVKCDLIAGLGVEELVTIPFDRDFQAKTAEQFVQEVLIEGEVVPGDRRGRELGMPTANIVPDDHLACPGHGVYAAWAHGHPAAVNVGVRPTFATGRGLLVEAYLLDFTGDLYGETLRIAFLERLRGERRFDSVDALVEQMQRDVERASEICSASVPP